MWRPRLDAYLLVHFALASGLGISSRVTTCPGVESQPPFTLTRSWFKCYHCILNITAIWALMRREISFWASQSSLAARKSIHLPTFLEFFGYYWIMLQTSKRICPFRSPSRWHFQGKIRLTGAQTLENHLYYLKNLIESFRNSINSEPISISYQTLNLIPNMGIRRPVIWIRSDQITSQILSFI